MNENLTDGKINTFERAYKWFNKIVFLAINSYFKESFISIILIAVIAASSPLFPSFPPLLSLACWRLLGVRTPKITGRLYFSPTLVIPFATASQIKSKCFVSPCITHPRQIIASTLPCWAINWEANVSSKLPGTFLIRIFFSLAPFLIRVFYLFLLKRPSSSRKRKLCLNNYKAWAPSFTRRNCYGVS